MKHRLMCLVAPLVLLSAPMAFAQARFQQVHEISVKPGQELVFENYIKKLAAGADKIGAKTYWTAYAVSIGKPGGTYRVALSFNSWAEREAWGTVPTIMVKAYGQQEAERMMKEGGNATERAVVEVWEHLPGSSANQTTPPAPAGNFARAQIVRVAPGMEADYEAMTVKFKPAYEAAAGKPLVTRWVLRVGANSGYTYRRVEQVGAMSDFDRPTGADVLRKFFGAQWAAMGAELNKMVTFRQEFISTRRPDLSRPAPAITSSR